MIEVDVLTSFDYSKPASVVKIPLTTWECAMVFQIQENEMIKIYIVNKNQYILKYFKSYLKF
jgi:hypothetical protein